MTARATIPPTAERPAEFPHASTLIYIAGPFSAPDRLGVEANIARAARRGLEVAKLGACPWIPHCNTAMPEFESAQPYLFWIKATMAQMKVCHALLTVDGWEASSGARGEVKAMTELGRPVFFDLLNLRDWLMARERAAG